ncbi:hypothetical protein AVEN_157733-1 [Araneus ventricosus]|uniref:Uncharacterized protein n=1 Tax=Araneus ventricosus TaxID=182803 RepID=A0A4Y2HB81_ARAVE|nr:hypothetical protein AVEN_157733-1 [Araneus ventricosus]
MRSKHVINGRLAANILHVQEKSKKYFSSVPSLWGKIMRQFPRPTTGSISIIFISDESSRPLDTSSMVSCHPPPSTFEIYHKIKLGRVPQHLPPPIRQVASTSTGY